MSERSSSKPHRSQDPSGHGNIRRTLPSGRATTASLPSMLPSYPEMASLSLQSTAPQERAHSTPPMRREGSPPRQVFHPKPGRVEPWTDYWESIMQPAPPGNTRAGTATSATIPSRQTTPPRHVAMPPPAPGPADCAAIYLAVYETHQPDISGILQISQRNCSIIVQHHPHVNKFSEYTCIPYRKRKPPYHLRFYWTHDLPDPRESAPGLLTMDFIACIPHRQVAVLDSFMKTSRSRIDENWSHNTWITVYLETMFQRGLITQRRMMETMIIEIKALDLPWKEEFPNRQNCFPLL
jgi:hypothetical protein